MTPAETARYTCELLESLRKIATRQGQGVLAHLLELAHFEAQSLAAGAKVPKTPGATAPKSRTPDSPDAEHNVPPARVPAEP